MFNRFYKIFILNRFTLFAFFILFNISFSLSQTNYYVAKNGPDKSFDVDQSRKDFVKFVDEHVKRRGTNFLETFPEYQQFYTEVKDGI